jgi:hypothetical protein
MNDRHFHLQLKSTYIDDKNEIEDLTVECLNDNKWEPLDLSIRSPGFLLFINGLFSCQHLYMRTNSAERNLVLESATGEMKIIAGEFWDIKDATITFQAKLKSGSPTEDDINYITERMKHCPVSSNLSDSLQINNSVQFDK